jgi:hypothetical protein
LHFTLSLFLLSGFTMNTYADRNHLLKEMGYESYRAYLDSDLWWSIKAQAFIFHGKACKLCRVEAVTLHHLGYGRDTLLGESLDQIVPLCDSCHHKVEFTSKGAKRTLVQAQTAYMRLWKELPKWKRTRGKCVRCGNKAKKGSRYCTPCRNNQPISKKYQSPPPNPPSGKKKQRRKYAGARRQRRRELFQQFRAKGPVTKQDIETINKWLNEEFPQTQHAPKQEKPSIIDYLLASGEFVKISLLEINMAKRERGYPYSKQQLAILGIGWPPPKDWQEQTVGKLIPKTKLDAFTKMAKE